MFGRSKKKNDSKTSGNGSNQGSGVARNAAPSVISADMNVLGSIISDGFIDIDGTVDGNVKCDSAIIRSNGTVKGDVTANSVQIYGYIEGLVKARSVSLYHSAHVSGTIMHESLTIEDGAFVDGKFKRMSISSDEETPASPSADEDIPASADQEMDEKVLDNLKLISG